MESTEVISQKRETATEVIKITPSSKELLTKLKLIEDESFSSVVNRLLQTKLEEMLVLNKDTKKMLDNRIQKIAEGKVLSFEDMMAKRRG